MNHPEGYHAAKIMDARVEVEEQGLVLCFDVETEHGEGTARHRCFGDYAEIPRKILEQFDLPWPHGIESLSTLKGRDCRVRIKHKTRNDGGTFVNWYIALPKRAEGKAATEDEVKAGIARLAEKDVDDALPF